MAEPRTRLDLHKILCEIVGEDRCYYEAPTHMKYPCIKYDDGGETVLYADNARYKTKRQWTITVIDENPDSNISVRLVRRLPYCRKDRVYASDGLYHFVYNLYY